MQKTAKSGPSFRNGNLGINLATIMTPIFPTVFGVAARWDLADEETVTVDGSGNIQTLLDKSGNNITISASNRPNYLADQINGFPVARFNGSGNVFTHTTTAIRALVLLAKWNGTTGDYRHLWDAETSGSLYGFHGNTAASGQLIGATWASPLVNAGQRFINGTLTATQLARYTNWTIHVITTSGNLNVSRSGDQPSYPGRTFWGDIAEIVYLNSVPTESDRQKIEGYLAHKYDLTASLPSDHPYKTNQP